jgi:DNA-binding NarL/FixJ family response regulator
MLSLEATSIFNVSVSTTCENAYNLLRNKLTPKFEFVFLDWNLPPFDEQKIFNGGDLVSFIRLHSPECKLIILTSHTEAFTLYHITNTIYPNALLCKIDFKPEDFPVVYQKIMNKERYFSSTVISQLKQITSRIDYLDNYNRQIILLLSKGIQTKNLPKYLPLSLSAVDKRKAQIKDYFLIANGTDEDIITAARKQGLIIST